MSVLSQDENKALATLLIDTEFERCVVGSPNRSSSEQELSDLREVIKSIPLYSEKSGTAIVRALLSKHRTAQLGLDQKLAKSLRRLAGFFAKNYLITVEVAAGPLEKVLIKYEYDSSYRGHPQYFEEGGSRRSWRRIRRLLGQHPFSFRLGIPLAFVAPSYHFRMVVPPGNYCSDQYVLYDPKRYASDKKSPEKVVLQEWHLGRGERERGLDYRGAHERGANYAHLYLHGLQDRQHFAVFSRIVFYERLPGSLGVVSLVSFLITATLAVIAFSARHALIHGGVDLGITAILLAIPGTVSFWIQPSLDRSELLTAPLASKLGLLGSGAFAYSGALTLTAAQLSGELSERMSWLVQSILLLLAAGSIAMSVVLILKLMHGVGDYNKVKDGDNG